MRNEGNAQVQFIFTLSYCDVFLCSFSLFTTLTSCCGNQLRKLSEPVKREELSWWRADELQDTIASFIFLHLSLSTRPVLVVSSIFHFLSFAALLFSLEEIEDFSTENEDEHNTKPLNCVTIICYMRACCDVSQTQISARFSKTLIDWIRSNEHWSILQNSLGSNLSRFNNL